jgi:hypothetical protein
MWDIEGRLLDTRPFATSNPERTEIGPNEPIHEIALRVTIDRDLLIHDVEARMAQGAFRACADIENAYRAIVGMNLGSGFSRNVNRLFKGTSGCPHLNELLRSIAATAHQGFWADITRMRGTQPSNNAWWEETPPAVDGCHALRRDGSVVRVRFPRLVEAPSPSA